MEYVFLALSVLEMLCVNVYTFHMCSEKKPPAFTVVSVISIFTALLFGAFYLLFHNTDLLGSGIFMVFGMVYIVPLTFLYRQPVKYSISIMCSSWIYTMLTYALSIQIAGLVPQWNDWASLLLFQTALYILTARPFFRFLTQKFLFILKNADQKTKNLLFWLGISWFCFAVLLNYALVFDISLYTAKITKVLVLCASALNAFMTYQIFYSFRRETQNASEYESALKLDVLTGLRNRMAFLEEAQAMIDGCIPFTIFFIDLDNFKSVNDDYGHIKGDQYLRQFSTAFSERFSALGTFYRISGDEFVFLYVNKKHGHPVYRKIESFTMRDCADIPFKGFSMGSASYPEDAQILNSLIMAADKRMYGEKKSVDLKRKSQQE